MEKKKKFRWEEEEKCIDPITFTDNDLEAIVLTNLEIFKRTNYGIRREKVGQKSTQITWSNGTRQWIVYSRIIDPGEVVELDANEVILPYSPERLKRIACHLKILPLYYGSIEAQTRGESTRKSALTVWLEGQPKEKRMTELYKNLEQQYWDELTKEEEKE